MVLAAFASSSSNLHVAEGAIKPLASRTWPTISNAGKVAAHPLGHHWAVLFFFLQVWDSFGCLGVI